MSDNFRDKHKTPLTNKFLNKSISLGESHILSALLGTHWVIGVHRDLEKIIATMAFKVERKKCKQRMLKPKEQAMKVNIKRVMRVTMKSKYDERKHERKETQHDRAGRTLGLRKSAFTSQHWPTLSCVTLGQAISSFSLADSHTEWLCITCHVYPL